jgi:hypothetical protein
MELQNYLNPSILPSKIINLKIHKISYIFLEKTIIDVSPLLNWQNLATKRQMN